MRRRLTIRGEAWITFGALPGPGSRGNFQKPSYDIPALPRGRAPNTLPASAFRRTRERERRTSRVRRDA